MRLRLRGYCVGVLLIYTITTSLPAVGRSEPTHPPKPHLPLALHNVRKSDLTTKRPNGERRHLNTWTEEEDEQEAFEPLGNMDGSQSRSRGGRPEHSRPRATMAPSSSDADPHKLMQRKEETSSSALPSNEDCSRGKVRHITKGKFYIIGQIEADIPNTGYQSDSAVSGKLLGLAPYLMATSRKNIHLASKPAAAVDEIGVILCYCGLLCTDNEDMWEGETCSSCVQT